MNYESPVFENVMGAGGSIGTAVAPVAGLVFLVPGFVVAVVYFAVVAVATIAITGPVVLLT